MSFCSLNDKLHFPFSLNSAFSVAMGKSFCLWFEGFFLILHYFFVMRKVLSQQFLTDQRAQTLLFPHIAVLARVCETKLLTFTLCSSLTCLANFLVAKYSRTSIFHIGILLLLWVICLVPYPQHLLGQ